MSELPDPTSLSNSVPFMEFLVGYFDTRGLSSFVDDALNEVRTEYRDAITSGEGEFSGAVIRYYGQDSSMNSLLGLSSAMMRYFIFLFRLNFEWGWVKSFSRLF